jgi:hypothetical protein
VTDSIPLFGYEQYNYAECARLLEESADIVKTRSPHTLVVVDYRRALSRDNTIRNLLMNGRFYGIVHIFRAKCYMTPDLRFNFDWTFILPDSSKIISHVDKCLNKIPKEDDINHVDNVIDVIHYGNSELDFRGQTNFFDDATNVCDISVHHKYFDKRQRGLKSVAVRLL